MMREAIRKIKQSSFLKHNAVFFLGSIAVGALNYAYYPVLGRLMQPGAFGEIQVLVSLFLQFTIFLNVLAMITVNIAANYKDQAKANRIIFELEKLAAYIAAGILAISIVAGDLLREQLQFSSMVPFVALALAFLVSVPLTFRSSFARGKKRFGVASISQLLGAAAKIVFSAGLVLLGLGVTGAIGGIVIAQLIAFLYAARWAARVGFNRPADTHYGTLPDLKAILPELKYAGAVLAGLLSITLLMSIDVIIAKYYFDPHTAGLYAGIATVARSIFFVATPIAQVLMPLVKINQSNKKNQMLLLKSFALTVLVCGPVLAVCSLLPDVIITILMGAEYQQYANLLPTLGLVVFIISLVNLVCMYYLALRQKMIMVVGIMGFAVSLGLMLVWHGNVYAIVHSMLIGSIFTLIATGIYVLVSLKRGVRNANQNDLDRDPHL